MCIDKWTDELNVAIYLIEFSIMKTLCHLKNKTGTRELHIELNYTVEERETLCTFLCEYVWVHVCVFKHCIFVTYKKNVDYEGKGKIVKEEKK